VDGNGNDIIDIGDYNLVKPIRRGVAGSSDPTGQRAPLPPYLGQLQQRSWYRG
jgi:hypothetical protein